MINKKFMILAIFLVSLLAVSAVSAADNATEDIVGVEETTDEVVSVNENQTISEDDVLRDSPGTFTDLANEIAKAGSTLNLNRNYAYTSSDSDYEEGITIDKTISINGNGYTINGINQVRAFKITASNVVLSNINFVNTYSNSNGGAIYWNGYNGILKDCSFVNSSIMYSFDGGSVYWNKDSGVLSGCSFMNSNGRYGGSVYWRGSNGVLEDCSFVKSGSDEGAVYWHGRYGTLKDCNFIDCSYHPNSGRSNQGGSVYWHADDGILCNCIFTNSYSKSEGGAIYWCGPRGSLSDCTFTNCRSRTYGGAIYLMGTNCTLLNSIFIEDSANYNGGAVEWYSGENGYMADCSFENCFAYEYGGSVLWRGDDCGTIYNCSFVSSSSGKSGGAVSWGSRYGIIEESIFINCHAGNDGGGISFSAKDCSLINSIFEGNTAQEGSDWYSSQPLIVINETKTSTVITAPDVSTTYGVSKNLIATLKDIDNNFLAGETISIVLNSKEQTLTTNSKGQVSLAIPTNLVPKTYLATIKYAGNDKYASSSTTTNVIVNKASTTLTASDVVADYNSGKYFTATLKDANGKAVKGAMVTLKIGSVTRVLYTDANGQVSLTTDGMIPDTYAATATFDGDNIYAKSSANAKVTINKLDTKLTARYDANSKNIVATVKDSNGNPVKGLRVGFALNGVKYVTTDANGQAKYSTAGLADGTYKVTVQASGNEIYKDSNKETVTFTIGSKEMSKIFLRNALYFVTQTKLVQVTLWDGNNQPLAGKTVYIRAYDSVWHGVTDENGDAFVRVGIGFGTHDATVSFDGDDQYNASTRAGYIRVIKQTPSVMVRGADTMFKATNPVKIVKVHLRDRYDQPLPEGSKIVLKLNGKTYIGFTDAEGVARIAISINTVGTFTAQAMYGGNTAYNPVTRDVKIRIV